MTWKTIFFMKFLKLFIKRYAKFCIKARIKHTREIMEKLIK